MESSNNLILGLSQDYLEDLMVRMAHHSTAIGTHIEFQGEFFGRRLVYDVFVLAACTQQHRTYRCTH